MRARALPPHESEPMPSYEVWRQDDNGHRYSVGAWPTREEAEQQRRELERRGHKQTYHVIVVGAGASDGNEPVRSGDSAS